MRQPPTGSPTVYAAKMRTPFAILGIRTGSGAVTATGEGWGGRPARRSVATGSGLVSGSRATSSGASVSLTGAWHGHVVVTCSSEAARHAAAAFLAMETAEVGDEDITDVMGELANIVGGNVKSMLPPATGVSLPHVVATADNFFPATRKICELAGTWLDEPFTVSMHQGRDAGVPAK